MIILSWNVRGAGRQGFTHEIMECTRQYHPDILFIMETRINQRKVANIISRLQYLFPLHIQIPAIGFLGLFGTSLGVVEKFSSVFF